MKVGFEREEGKFEEQDIEIWGSIISDTEFHHYVYVRRGLTHSLYMDGELVAIDTFDEGPADTSGLPLIIGGHCNGAGCFPPYPYSSGAFNGIIDEVRIYNRALSDDEIEDQYQFRN